MATSNPTAAGGASGTSGPNPPKPTEVALKMPGAEHGFPYDPRTAWYWATGIMIILGIIGGIDLIWGSGTYSIFSLIMIVLTDSYIVKGDSTQIAGLYYRNQLCGVIGPNPGSLFAIPWFTSIKMEDYRRPDLNIPEVRVLTPPYTGPNPFLDELAKAAGMTFQEPPTDYEYLTRPITIHVEPGKGTGANSQGSHFSYEFNGAKGFYTVMTTEGGLNSVQEPLLSIAQRALIGILQKTPYYYISYYIEGINKMVNDESYRLLEERNKGRDIGVRPINLNIDIRENVAIADALDNIAKAEVKMKQQVKYDVPAERAKLTMTYQVEVERLDAIIASIGGQNKYLVLEFLKAVAVNGIDLNLIAIPELQTMFAQFMQAFMQRKTPPQGGSGLGTINVTS